jgi:hypothetical protein
MANIQCFIKVMTIHIERMRFFKLNVSLSTVQVLINLMDYKYKTKKKIQVKF